MSRASSIPAMTSTRWRKYLRGLRQEPFRVASLAQGIRADDANAARVHVAQPLAEAGEAVKRPLLALRVEALVPVEPGGKPDRFAQPIHDRELDRGRNAR